MYICIYVYMYTCIYANSSLTPPPNNLSVEGASVRVTFRLLSNASDASPESAVRRGYICTHVHIFMCIYIYICMIDIYIW